MNEKEMQESMMMYQLLQSTLEELQKQLLMVQKKLKEIHATEIAISEIGKSPKDNDILVPIGTGVYGFGKLTSTDNILVNVGADILVKKSPVEAKTFLELRKNEIEEASGKIERDMKKIVARMNEIANVMNASAKNPPESE